MSGSEIARLNHELGNGAEVGFWLAHLASLPDKHESPVLPGEATCRRLLMKLGLTPQDAAEAATAILAIRKDRALSWLLAQCYSLIVDNMGDRPWLMHWPTLPTSLGVAGRYFYVAVFLAALPCVSQYHQDRGIPEDVTWASLSDLGEKVASHRRMYGVGGLGRQNWLLLPYTGQVYTLGRLQFQLAHGRTGLDTVADDVVGNGSRDRRCGPGADDAVLDIHVPASGPLVPQLCDESLRWAADFFADHFSEHDFAFGTCRSWLLDEQLAEYLAEDTNIVRFQRRFHLVPGVRNADQEMHKYMFAANSTGLGSIPPPRTRLEHAVLAHLEAGRHWRIRSGWCHLTR